MTLIAAIIEATPAGDRLRARLLLTESSQQIIPIVLAGVRCPSASRKGGAGDETVESTGQAEEFGDEARWFVESKLLQRNVKIEIMYVLVYGIVLILVVLTRLVQCLLLRSSILLVISRSFLF